MQINMNKVDGTSLPETVVRLLIKEKKTATFAESCTGGLLAKKITDIAGASECFECSFVTYSNEKKTKLLGVRPETLQKFGAVSYQTAYEMCEGAKKAADADIGIGITGIAGPGGGTKEKPVGLVYLGICTDSVHGVIRLNLNGSRSEIRDMASNCALEIIRCAMLGEIEKDKDNPMLLNVEFVY